MMMLTGSSALSYLGSTHMGLRLRREPRDLDGIGTFEAVNKVLKSQHQTKPFQSILPAHDGKKLIGYHPDHPWEFEIAWSGSSAESLLKLVSEDPATIHSQAIGGALIPSLDVLYTLKMSHRYLRNSPAFLKTMEDIHDMRAAGATVPEPYKLWLMDRQKETYSYGHPNLNQGKMGFFSGDGVKYTFDHDTIHDAMALHGRPAYTFYQKDGAQVACDRRKWDALSEEYRLAGVLEESYVLALERSQIPHAGAWTPERSFQMALMKVCTSITSGWFREYAWENYWKVRARYDDTYVTRFWAAVEAGVVKRLDAIPAQAV